MNLFGLSPGELLLIGLVAMIVLGPEKLPEVAASAGKWIREFRRATEELTSQFADENPFTEIQKALALDDLLAPTVINTAPDVPAVTSVVTSEIETPAVAVAPVVSQPTVPERVKSYHFFGTPNHPGLDPEWIVGVPIRDEFVPPSTDHALADDEWLHGVPVLPEEPAPASDEAILDTILTTSADLEVNGTGEVPADDAVPLVPVDAADLSTDTNGHSSATTLEGLAVEAAPAPATDEEAVAESTGAEAATSEPGDATREDVTLILDPGSEERNEDAHHEPAFVGGDAMRRVVGEEHQP